MDLLNKGIIPKDVDLTPAFEKGSAPMGIRGMRLFEKQTKHVKGEIMMAQGPQSTIKYDLQPAPPVFKPLARNGDLSEETTLALYSTEQSASVSPQRRKILEL